MGKRKYPAHSVIKSSSKKKLSDADKEREKRDAKIAKRRNGDRQTRKGSTGRKNDFKF